MFAGTEKLTWEIAVIGRIGKSLALDCHAVIVIVGVTVFPCGTSAQPVAGIYLCAGLRGQYLKHPATLIRHKARSFYKSVLVPVVEHPAVVISLAYL